MLLVPLAPGPGGGCSARRDHSWRYRTEGPTVREVFVTFFSLFFYFLYLTGTIFCSVALKVGARVSERGRVRGEKQETTAQGMRTLPDCSKYWKSNLLFPPFLTVFPLFSTFSCSLAESLASRFTEKSQKVLTRGAKIVNIDEIKTMHKSGMNYSSASKVGGQSLFSLACRACMIKQFLRLFLSSFEKAGCYQPQMGC